MRALATFVLMLIATLSLADSPSTGGLLPFGLRLVPAGISLFTKRIGSSDTVWVRVSAGFDPSYGRSGEWSIVLPPGLSRLSGPTEARGAKRDINGVHELYLRCERWGDFELFATMTALQDSLNFVRSDHRAVVHITADSFTVTRKWGPPGTELQYVIDGVHYRQHSNWWLPLDPGEDEEVEPGFDSHANLLAAPALHVESAARMAVAGADSVVEVPIVVAVDRTGRVKDASPNVGQQRIPGELREAALAAAWKWRFAPAHSLGRPVSTIYVIKVPVATASDH